MGSSVRQSGSRTTPREDVRDAVCSVPLEFEEIGGLILPYQETEEESGVYPEITPESALGTDGDSPIADGSAYPRDGLETAEKLFANKEYGQEKLITDKDRNRYSSEFDCLTWAGRILNRTAKIRQEQRRANAVFNPSTFTTPNGTYTDYSSGAPWTNTGTSIITQLRTAITAVRNKCGWNPDTIVFAYDNIRLLQANTELLQETRYTGAGSLIDYPALFAILQDHLNIKRILVGNAMRNTAAKGQTKVVADVWSPLYCLVAKTMGDDSQPALGKTYIWNRDSAVPYTMEEYYEDQTRSNILRYRHNTDERVNWPEMGHLLKIRAA